MHDRAKEVVGEVIAAWGRVDVLVNNAGRSMATGILDITEEQFDQTLGVNLKSCFNYIQAVAPHMLAAKYGRIVSMSSLNAHSGGVTAAVSRFAYASAKAGIIGMTRALAKELGPHIAVNCVCPGLIKTEVGKNAALYAREAELAKGRGNGPRRNARRMWPSWWRFSRPSSPASSPARTSPSTDSSSICEQGDPIAIQVPFKSECETAAQGKRRLRDYRVKGRSE